MQTKSALKKILKIGDIVWLLTDNLKIDRPSKKLDY